MIWAGAAWKSLWTTVKLSAIAAPLTAALGLLAAYLLTRQQFAGRSAFEFGINGVAKAVDKNHDGKADAIQTGKWGGTLSYAGTPAALGTATFTGTRL